MTIPAYVPQIGLLLQGLNYDMTVAEEVTHANEMSRHPIEDPTRSFIYDHNREEPVTMQLSLVVSADPLIAGEDMLTRAANLIARPRGAERLVQFQERLLAMRSAQSVSTDAFFTVQTGLRAYHNMGIESLSFRREVETPNVLEVDLTLVEHRFAAAPRAVDQQYLMLANSGPRSQANAILVDQGDRPITEATRRRFAPRLLSPSEQARAVIAASIRSLPDGMRASLGIDIVNGSTSDANLGIFMLDDVPSQQYTVRLDGEDHDLTFMFNQMADRWSFSASISFGDCPKIGGRLVEPGLNLYAGVASDTLLIALDRPGISTTGVDWYARLTAPLGDGLPATMLVTGSVAAFNGLFRPRTAIAC